MSIALLPSSVLQPGALDVQTTAKELARPSPPGVSALVRAQMRGKFLFVGEEKLFIRGVTYGAFRPDADGREYHDLQVIERDFAQMTAAGVNAVRIPHTTPPPALLDAAARHGLRVMVGLSAEQYLGFLIDGKKRLGDIAELICAKVQTIAGHPALLCYALGNEISASIARWLGPRNVERYLERLYQAVKAEDPGSLVTYVNYPTTEYLRLPFLDLMCFNVYLEAQEPFGAYLARLHHIAGNRPLLMSEIGLDSLRHGESEQARVLDWQIRAAFASGCAGAFVFAWTDEWYRAGAEVTDWAFGLTTPDRRPKPALAAVQRAFREVPAPPDVPWPSISVIVCTHNGARTLRRCLEGLRTLDYPSYDVIVVDDGSTDDTSVIASEFRVHVIRTEQGGLACARNAGLEAATGEIVAYIDDDAYPDPHWLTYLAMTFLATPHAGVGGPNIAPSGDGFIADCVANAPGGPVHVLISDQAAEHIPGCNMAFRTAYLRAIGGFDPQFRIAGDDVDVCWRFWAKGATLGFSPAAVVWHHRRNSIRAYWRQQREYGKAEALLARKWPEKYNGAGHVTWAGRVYGAGRTPFLGWGGRIYHGVWGSAPFQSLYDRAPGPLWSLPAMPEWYLVICVLGGLTSLAALWRPLLSMFPLFALAVCAPIALACMNAAQATFRGIHPSPTLRLRLRALTAVLCAIQPLARLYGRLRFGLAPWRLRPAPPGARRGGGVPPLHGASAFWSNQWHDPDERLRRVEATLKAAGAGVRRGGDHDRWDLEVCSGMLGAARVLMAVEDHGAGTQLVRFRWWPRWSAVGVVVTLALAALAADAVDDGALAGAAVLGALAIVLAHRTAGACADAVAAIRQALDVEAR